jgi:hypothetical protein
VKTTTDRQTGRRFRYDPALSVKCREFQTVGRWDNKYPKCGPTIRFLGPSRLTPELFKRLNPGKVQPVCIRPQDDPDLRSTARPAQVPA